MFLTLLVIAFLILSLVLHELAHWYEMERKGLRVAEAGLGLPIPYLTLKFTVMRRGQPVTLKFSPLLIAAYVKADDAEEEAMRNQPYRTVADIAGAGPIANFAIGFALMAALPLIDLAYPNVEVGYPIIGRVGLPPAMLAALFLLAAVATWKFRSFLSAYVLPFVGLLTLALLAVVILQEPERFVQPENGGPVAIGRLVHDQAQDLLKAVILCANINLGLGMLNALPLGPTDGGHIFNTAIRPRFPRFAAVFSTIGTLLILTLVVLALVNDVRSFF